MSIQDRLREQRYSKQQIRLSYKDIRNSGLYTHNYFTTKYRPLIVDTTNRAMSQIINPPKTDRYYKDNHQKITTDYLKYCYNTKGTNKHLILNKLVIPLAYYILNHSRYQTYEHIGISITVGIMQHMRKAIMRKMILLGELPLLFDRVSPASNGFYPLYKPMRIPTTSILRDNLYHIALPLAMKYIEFHKKYNKELTNI